METSHHQQPDAASADRDPFAHRSHFEYELTVRQEPKQARMCGIGGKADRRPIDPPCIVQLRVIDRSRSSGSGSSTAPSTNIYPQPLTSPPKPNSNEQNDNELDELDEDEDEDEQEEGLDSDGTVIGDGRNSARPRNMSNMRTNTNGKRTRNRDKNSEAPSTPISDANISQYPPPSYLQNPYYFMFASLAKPDDDTELHFLKDGRTRSTTGSVVSSLYHLKDTEHNNEDAGFFVFPDLSVRTEGSYRLKLSLFEIVGEDVRHCKYIFSSPFYVYTAKKFPGMEESTPLSCSLADQGIKIRIRKDVRVRRRQNPSFTNGQEISSEAAAPSSPIVEDSTADTGEAERRPSKRARRNDSVVSTASTSTTTNPVSPSFSVPSSRSIMNVPEVEPGAIDRPGDFQMNNNPRESAPTAAPVTSPTVPTGQQWPPPPQPADPSMGPVIPPPAGAQVQPPVNNNNMGPASSPSIPATPEGPAPTSYDPSFSNHAYPHPTPIPYPPPQYGMPGHLPPRAYPPPNPYPNWQSQQPPPVQYDPYYNHYPPQPPPPQRYDYNSGPGYPQPPSQQHQQQQQPYGYYDHPSTYQTQQPQGPYDQNGYLIQRQQPPPQQQGYYSQPPPPMVQQQNPGRFPPPPPNHFQGGPNQYQQYGPPSNSMEGQNSNPNTNNNWQQLPNLPSVLSSNSNPSAPPAQPAQPPSTAAYGNNDNNQYPNQQQPPRGIQLAPLRGGQHSTSPLLGPRAEGAGAERGAAGVQKKSVLSIGSIIESAE